MRRTSRIWLVLVAISLLSTGCNRIDELLGRGPRQILEKFLAASLRGNKEEAYNCISSSDRRARSLAQYKGDAAESPLVRALADRVSFTIQTIDVHGDTATAAVRTTSPDFSVLFKDLFGAAFVSAFSGRDQKELEKTLAEKYAKTDAPTTTRSENFNLVKESDGWKVFLDWETEGKVTAALGEARTLRRDNKLRAALAKLDEVLELKSEMVEAKKERDEVQRDIREFDEKQAYIDKVILYDLKGVYYETYLDKRVPGVEFKLRNTGDRTLKKVKVTVYFKDASGTVIHEQDYSPVLVTEFSFSGDNKPLKPGYIWQLERGKFYKAEAVPNEWKEGSVSAKVADIQFGEK